MSEKEPMPDTLLTVLMIMLMPNADFVDLIAESTADAEEHSVTADGGGQNEAQNQVQVDAHKRVQDKVHDETRIGEEPTKAWRAPRVDRPPLLDISALEGEPVFAALVSRALVVALDAKAATYTPEAEAVEAARGVKWRMARTLRERELSALQAARAGALQLLVLADGEESEKEGDEGGGEGEGGGGGGEEETPGKRQRR